MGAARLRKFLHKNLLFGVLVLAASASAEGARETILRDIRNARMSHPQARVKLSEHTIVDAGRPHDVEYEWAFKGDKLYAKGRQASGAKEQPEMAADFVAINDGKKEQTVSYPFGYPNLKGAQTTFGKSLFLARSINPLTVAYQYNNTWLDKIIDHPKMKILPEVNDPQWGRLIRVSVPHINAQLELSLKRTPKGLVGVKAVRRARTHDIDWVNTQTVSASREVAGVFLPTRVEWTLKDATKSVPQIHKTVEVKYVETKNVPDSLFAFKTLPAGAVEVDSDTLVPYRVGSNGSRTRIDAHVAPPREMGTAWLVVGGSALGAVLLVGGTLMASRRMSSKS